MIKFTVSKDYACYGYKHNDFFVRQNVSQRNIIACYLQAHAEKSRAYAENLAIAGMYQALSFVGGDVSVDEDKLRLETVTSERKTQAADYITIRGRL